jgi:hypothetical protein
MLHGRAEFLMSSDVQPCPVTPGWPAISARHPSPMIRIAPAFVLFHVGRFGPIGLQPGRRNRWIP